MNRRAAILAMVALLVATGARAGQGEPWQTDLGSMRIEDLGNPDFVATYARHHGRVFGRLEGRRMTGTWTQERGEQRCDRPYAGSYYWGAAVFEFDRSFSRFNGGRGFCGTSPRSPWNGARGGAVTMPEFVLPPQQPGTPCEQYPLGCGPGYSNPALRGIDCQGRTETGCLCWKGLAGKAECDAYRREKRGY